jgi:hypothetical protein
MGVAREIAMKFIAFTLMFSAWALLAATDEQDRRVRATEPTVVTVRGTSEEVATQEPISKRSGRSNKLGQTVRKGTANALKSVVGAAVWLLNADDDIPRKQDRERTSADPNGDRR